MKLPIVLPIILLSIPMSAFAAKKVMLQPESTLSLKGDSTLHPFTSQTTQLQVSGELDPQLNPAGSGQHLDIVIPVQSLKSKESGLDKNMYKALKADACPEISFHMTGYTVQKDPADTKTMRAQVQGTLSIACQTQPVTLEADLTTGTPPLDARGKYLLLMTDYGIKPPSLMLGAIKVKNPVTIEFHLQLGFVD